MSPRRTVDMSAPTKIEAVRSQIQSSNELNHSTNHFIMSHVKTFQSSIIRIRNILRGQAITGMDSMRHICLYLMSRYMTRSKALSLGIPDDFSWETLNELLHRSKVKGKGVIPEEYQFVLDRFSHKGGDCLVNHFDRLFDTDQFPFVMTNPIRHKDILDILATVEIDQLSDHMDILGWVYEQHLKTGATAARDLGQHFTARPICTYMTELCRPGFKCSDVPESMCDPSMGTGGFQIAYMKYYKIHHHVDWEVHQKKIHGCDIDPRLAGVARLNLFMETGGVRFDHMLHRDSLYGDLPQTGYDVILANMPFGIDGLKYDDCCKRVTALNISGNQSEPLFLQLMMVSLNVGGRCAVVVPEGMLVNISACHNGTRKYLLDHFELKRVIKMRGKFFMNTSIQTSILFFENTGKPTEAVEFWDLIKNANGSVKEKMVLSVLRAAMDEACSLDLRRSQEVKEVANPAGFPIVTISDQCSMVIGGTPLRSRNDYYENGQHVWVSVSELNHGIIMDSKEHINDEGVKHSNVKPVRVGSVLMSFKMSIGKCAVAGVDLYTNEAIVAWYSNDETVLSNPYLFYYLSLRDLSHAGKGSIGAGSMNKESLSELTIPLPPLAIQQEIVATLDRIYQPGTTELADTLKLTSQAMDLVLAQPSGATLEPIVEAQRLIRKSAQMVADVKAQMAAMMKSVGCRGFPVGKMGDHMSFMNGYAFKSEEFMDAGVPVVKIANIKSSVLSFEKVQYAQKAVKLSKYTVKPNDMVISLTGELSGDVGLNLTETEWYLNQRVARIDITDKEIHHKYMYYYMLYSGFTESVRAISTGSAQPNVSTKNIEELTMPLPPLAFQHALVARLDALQSHLTALESLQRQSEDNARFILESYLYTEQAPSAEQQASSSEDDEKEEPRIIRRPRSVSPARPAESGAESSESTVIPDYASMSLAALKDLCKERGLRGLSGKKKEELVVILRDLS